jgi:hypothetical protein
MASFNFPTQGDGKLYRLQSKGVTAGVGNQRPSEVLYSVTIICPAFSLAAVANANGVAVGTDGSLLTYMAPGDSLTFNTRDLGGLCWQDISGAASILAIHVEVAAITALQDAKPLPSNSGN